MQLNKFELIFLLQQGSTHHGELSDISVRGCWPELIIEDRLLLGNFGKSLRKWEFVLDWLLSGNKGNSMVGMLYK